MATQIRGNTQVMDQTIENTQVRAIGGAYLGIEFDRIKDGSKILLDDSAVLAADLDAGGYVLTNIGDGVNDSDAASYGQLQSVVTQAKLWKEVVFHEEQLKDSPSGGIYGAQVIKMGTNLATGDTVSLNDGTSTENFVADTDFTVGATINDTITNLANEIDSNSSIAVTAVTDSLDSIDPTNLVMVIIQDTIGEATDVFGNAGAAAKLTYADPTLDNLYEADATDLVAIPTADGSGNFGFSRAQGSLVANETHMSRNNDGSYTWDDDWCIFNTICK